MRIEILLWPFPSAACHAAIIEGLVGVNDSDTVAVLDGGKVQYKIRLAGIDAARNNATK